MTIRHFAPLAALAISLAACSGAEDAAADGEVTADEVAAMSDGMAKPVAGQYESTMKIVSLDVPGAPPEMVEMMRSGMGEQGMSSKYCLTQADADKGYEEAFKEAQEQSREDGSQCSYERFVIDGSDVDAKMTCTSPDGTAEIAMTGTVQPKSQDMRMTMTATGADMPGGKMTTEMTLNSRWIGECGPGEG